MLFGFAITCPRSTSVRSIPRSSNPAVVARHALVQRLVEHLHSRHHRGHALLPQPDYLHRFPYFHPPAVDPPGHYRPAPLDREHILHRHHERFVHISHRLRYVFVHHPQQLFDAVVFRRIRILARALQGLPSALPRTIGVVSPGNLYSVNSSRSSSSTNSNSSGSSIMSTLFKYTTIAGTSTCRASSTCSRVCGIGPSGAATTRIAPSTCAAPVIMFLM